MTFKAPETPTPRDGVVPRLPPPGSANAQGATGGTPDEAGPSQSPTRFPFVLKVAATALVSLLVASATALAVSVSHTSDVRDGYRDDMSAMRVDFAKRATVASAQARSDQAEAVQTAVREQRSIATRKLHSALTKQRRTDAKKLKAAVSDARASAYSAGTADGYSSGATDGYSSGAADGFDEGLTSGSDDLTCSDDPDVYWLPACY